MKTVLVIEDDAAVARGLKDNLEFEGLRVRHAGSGERGLVELEERPPDVLLLDLMLPGLSGFDVLRRLQDLAARPRVVVVSARDDEADIVRALDLGAHDYVKKPFGLSELLARVRAQLRDGAGANESHDGTDEFAFGDVRVSLRRFRLWKGDVESLLSHHEVAMLRLFRARSDQPLTRAQILDAAWPRDAYPTERTVDNFVLKLRRKIEDDPARPRFLVTVFGVGYRFSPGGGNDTE